MVVFRIGVLIYFGPGFNTLGGCLVIIMGYYYGLMNIVSLHIW